MKEHGWERACTLPDGTRVTLRPMRPDDKAELRRAILALSEETTMRRFLRAHVEPSEAVLAHLTEVDQENHVAVVAVVASPDLKEERFAAVGRFVRMPDNPAVAESAVTVADDFQHRGLGRVMLMELVWLARRHGITRFRAEVLKDNLPVNTILSHVQSKKVAESDLSATFEVDLGEDPDHPVIYDLFRAVARSFRRVVELTTGTSPSDVEPE
jgi:GNAT superfamily N-acetyltransferase